MTLDADEALAFVRDQGVVLVAARGPAPRLTEAIAGEPIGGSWWAHPQGRAIYAVLRHLSADPAVLVCRLVNGHLTLVHRRLWPALVRLAGRFDPRQLAQVREQHTAAGHHVSRAVDYPAWVPPSVRAEAARLSEEQALAVLGPFAGLARPAAERSSRPRRAARTRRRH